MKILFIVAIFSTCLISQDAGYKLYKDGDIESALEYYKALIQLGNDDISQEDILYNIGTIYSNMDSTSEAGSIFQQTYHDSLDFSSDLSYNYGNVLYRNEQLDKSLEAYKNTLLRDPNDSDARKNYEFVKNKIKENKNMENSRTRIKTLKIMRKTKAIIAITILIKTKIKMKTKKIKKIIQRIIIMKILKMNLLKLEIIKINKCNQIKVLKIF